MTAIRFTQQGSKFEISFKYDARLVDWLKTAPSWARTWNPDRKVWTVEAQYAHSLASEWRQAGFTILGMDAAQQRANKAPPPPPPRPKALPSQSNWAVALIARFEQEDPALRERAYKALAKVLHGDVGGDHRLMQELNDARNAADRAHREGKAG